MNTPSHTPEPWIVDWGRIRNDQCETVCGWLGAYDDPQWIANRARIVDCVNACTDISDPATAISKAVDALNHIRALVVNENALTYDEIMEHVEKHADIGLAGLRNSTTEQSQRGPHREASK